LHPSETRSKWSKRTLKSALKKPNNQNGWREIKASKSQHTNTTIPSTGFQNQHNQKSQLSQPKKPFLGVIFDEDHAILRVPQPPESSPLDTV
jgi:hypothetical protein